jgi:hypothetical protein
MTWDNEPTLLYIPEWGVTLAYAWYDDAHVERLCGDLDLGIAGWLPARVTMDRCLLDEEVRYTFECGPQRAITLRTEWHASWHASGEHVCLALRELTDLIAEIPRVDRAVKAIEERVLMERARKAHNDAAESAALEGDEG